MLLAYLDTSSIEYCLLGAADSYPNVLGDIDISISRESFKSIDSIVQNFCTQHRLLLIQKLVHESTGYYYVLSHFNAEDNSFAFIDIDFCSDYMRSGRLYITAEQLMANRQLDTKHQYWKGNDTYSFLYYFIKKLDKGGINPLQFGQLLACWQQARQSICEVLQTYFDSRELNIICTAFDTENQEMLTDHFKEIRNNLLAKKPKRAKDVLRDKARLLKRAMVPTGLMICILGRDGSGKSTFSTNLVNSLQSCFRDTSKYHLYPGLIFRNQPSAELIKLPHSQKARSSLLSFFKLELFYIEFFLGYWLKIYPQKVRSTFLLFDRYFIDVLIDPVRYRNTNNQRIIKLFHKMLPKPDVWIILDISSEVLMTRKNELSFELSESLRNRYLGIKDYLPNSILINTEKAIPECINEATAFVLQKMNKKLIKQ